jgi:hypothetical protein
MNLLIIGLAISFVLGSFTPHAVERLSQWIGTAWHLATRRRLEEHDATTYAIHKQLKIHQVRTFFRMSPPCR